MRSITIFILLLHDLVPCLFLHPAPYGMRGARLLKGVRGQALAKENKNMKHMMQPYHIDPVSSKLQM